MFLCFTNGDQFAQGKHQQFAELEDDCLVFIRDMHEEESSAVQHLLVFSPCLFFEPGHLLLIPDFHRDRFKVSVIIRQKLIELSHLVFFSGVHCA